MWKSPNLNDLQQVVATANKRLLLCSPFVSRPGLAAVEEALPTTVGHIDIWTRLSTEDWLTGASQPDGLLEFIDAVAAFPGRSIAMRTSPDLHAKIILPDGPEGIAGSSNLTGGGFGRNIEVVRHVRGQELAELRSFTESIRPRLQAVSLESFRNFVAQCLAKVDSQEALLDLIRTEMPPPSIGPRPMISYRAYLDSLQPSIDPLDQQIRTIALNLDQNNNGGKIKHAFYGIQRFLQEYPQHIPFVASLPRNQWFDVSGSPLEQDWRAFLRSYESEHSPAYQYSMWTLVHTYLTPTSGGTRTGGGGGDNELKRVWPSTGQLMAGAP
jgi:hypothetical protein